LSFDAIRKYHDQFKTYDFQIWLVTFEDLVGFKKSGNKVFFGIYAIPKEPYPKFRHLILINDELILEF